MRHYGSMIFLCLLLMGLGVSLGAQNASGTGAVLSLDEVLAALGSPQNRSIEFHWDPFLQTGTFTGAGRRASFMSGSAGEQGVVLIDNREIISVPAAPFMVRGLLYFPEAFVAILRGAFAVPDPQIPEPAPFRIAAIIVDPGHGGKDSGAVGTHTINGRTLRLLEKDLTLKVSQQLHAFLQAAYRDKRIILTRNGDTYPSLEDRVLLANSIPLGENEAIIFISIHANSSFNKTARGYEVWYLSPEYRRTVIDPDRYDDSADVRSIRNAMMEEEFTTESILLAQALLKRLDESLGRLSPSRGIKANDWFVVRNTWMPSVLVEMPFVTNEEDARILSNDTYLRNISEALYKGITDFVNIFERSGGFTGIQ